MRVDAHRGQPLDHSQRCTGATAMTMINARNAGPISHAMACTPMKTTTIAAAPRSTSKPRGRPTGLTGPAPFGDAPGAPFAGVAAEAVIRLTLGTARTSASSLAGEPEHHHIEASFRIIPAPPSTASTPPTPGRRAPRRYG